MEASEDPPARERPAADVEAEMEMERRPAVPAAGDELVDVDAAAGSPLLRGVQAAATITVGTLVLEGVTLLAHRLIGGGPSLWFLVLGMAIAGAGMLLLILAAARLPPRARVPFWAMGILLVMICFLLVGQTCGIVL
jgi:hypothetical protein